MIDTSDFVDPRATAAGHEADTFQRAFTMAAPTRQARVRSIASEQLFAGFAEVRIAHGDAVHRRCLTAIAQPMLAQ